MDHEDHPTIRIMARNVLKISSERTGQTPGVRVVRSALYCTAAALLFRALWVELIYPPPWLAAGLLFLTSAMLALALTGAFDNSGLDACWRARLPFLLAALFPLACWLLRLLLALPVGVLSAGLPLALGELALAGLGAFLGALSATAVLYGLWEDNSPPGEPLRQEVLERHRQATGAPPPVPPAKRLFDLLAAGLGLLVSAPVWLACIFAIWFEDPGPLLFVKNSVGRGGGNFRQFKLRSMVRGAEEHTGPVLAQHDDPRVLACGRFLRKTALDELPQLLNILRGEMSFVGPRRSARCWSATTCE